MGPLDRPLAVTIFPSYGASSKIEEALTMRNLAERILSTTGPSKDKLPWLKLAKFGSKKTDKGSLRHNANLTAISGVEGDYDGGVIAVDEAVNVLCMAGLAGMIYTSPSHTEDEPRWRVMCPLGAEVPPDARADLVARLNGAFQGALAGESFTASQSYYYGSVGNNPSHRVELVDGDYLDQRSDLDPRKIGKPAVSAPVGEVSAPRFENNSAFIESVIRRALDKVRQAPDGSKHDILRSQAITLGGFQHVGGYAASEAVGWLMSALPATTNDRRAAEVTARWGIEQGMARPIQQPHRQTVARTDLQEVGNVVNMRPVPKAKREPPAQRAGWQGGWHLSDQGSPLPTLFNAMVAMRGHHGLSSIVRFDEMARTAILVDQIPGAKHDATIPRPIRDDDVIAIQEALQDAGLRRIAKATVQDAIERRSVEDKFHPVRDYLNGLVWDGKPRVNGWLSRYLGVKRSDYVATVGRLFLVALMARQFKPGCKADYMLILEGPQGAQKSTACRVLAGEWFSDNLPDLSRGDAVRLSMHLRGKWLVEIAEMSSFNSAEAHTLKEFITQTVERYTPKYGRNEVCEPRQCLFIGSTNETSYLRDATGARRFWPVVVGDIDLDALRADRDQLLAESVQQYREGAKWWPERDFEAEHIAPQQEARFDEDPWEVDIVNWINRENIQRCCATEVLRMAVGMSLERVNKREASRVRDILLRIGMLKHKVGGVNYFTRVRRDRCVSVKQDEEHH